MTAVHAGRVQLIGGAYRAFLQHVVLATGSTTILLMCQSTWMYLSDLVAGLRVLVILLSLEKAATPIAL